jgi:hypothetical protein
VGPRAVLDAVVKRKIPSSRQESNPRTPIVQPVAQRYTDWAMTALANMREVINMYLILVGTSRKGRNLSIDGMIILKWALNRVGGVDWIQVSQDIVHQSTLVSTVSDSVKCWVLDHLSKCQLLKKNSTSWC